MPIAMSGASPSRKETGTVISANFARVIQHLARPKGLPATVASRASSPDAATPRRKIRFVHATALAEIFSQTRCYQRYITQPVSLHILFPFGEFYRETDHQERPDFWIVYGETHDGKRQPIIETFCERLAAHVAQVLADLWATPDREQGHRDARYAV